jgi:hypothetical protein
MKSTFSFLFALLLTVATTAHSQNSDLPSAERKNSLFLELGGSALWYSVNYGRKISLAPFHRLTVGAGMSVMPPTKAPNVLGLASVNYLLGKMHNLEIGGSAGNMLFPVSERDTYILSCRLGYRYEGNSGFQFRAGLLPLIGPFKGVPDIDFTPTYYMPFAYVSFGYSFGYSF